LDKPDRFRSTIGANSPAAIIIVPVGDDGCIQVLHHGALFARGLGFDPEAVFVTGNRASAPLKLLNVDDAVRVIGTGANPATRPKTIETPDLDDYFGVESKDDFISLEPMEKNTPLKDRPNHMLIGLRTLDILECCPVIEASELAWRIIQAIEALPNTGDETEEAASVQKAKDDSYVLLSYLWHVAKRLGRNVKIEDVGDADDALDNFCSSIRNRLSNPSGGGGIIPTSGTPINVTVDNSTLNATQQALLLSMNSMSASLLAADSEKKDKKSILNGMAPSSRELFTRLCTRNLRREPAVVSDFLKSLLSEKNASHISNHLRATVKGWKGTFIEGAFCRFLSKGFISQRENMLPGGFTIFMFIPKECEPARDGYKENMEALKELWNQDVGADTLARLAKMDLFLPKNVHHLEIQLETAMKMLDVLTVPGGCASASIYAALRFVKRNSAHISRLIGLDTMLAVKISYQLDVELQKFFSLVSDHEGDIMDIDPDDATYARDQLSLWLYGLEVNRAVTVMLPDELGGNSRAFKNYMIAGEVIDSDHDDDHEPKKKKAKAGGTSGTGDDRSSNGHMLAAWTLPKGKSYASIFNSENLKGWPIVRQPNGPRKSLCVKFQAKGQCKVRCGFSHAYHHEIDEAVKVTIGEKFKAAYDAA